MENWPSNVARFRSEWQRDRTLRVTRFDQTKIFTNSSLDSVLESTEHLETFTTLNKENCVYVIFIVRIRKKGRKWRNCR